MKTATSKGGCFLLQIVKFICYNKPKVGCVMELENKEMQLDMENLELENGEIEV